MGAQVRLSGEQKEEALRVLLDTHFVIWIAEARKSLTLPAQTILADPEASFHVSAATFWEMSITHAKGKLPLSLSPPQMAAAMERLGVSHLHVTHEHANAALDEAPMTDDPFDRLLLAQCQVEGMRLLTLDKKLRRHPLALRI
jgi:PIN domain nuclease of toxin-antitoxin system